MISLQGRLTADPELRKSQGGVARTSFSLAVDGDYKNQNGEYETDFIHCAAWRGTAEFICRNFTKGQLATVQGRLRVRNWTDQAGNRRELAEVHVENIYFCGGKKATSDLDIKEPAGYEEIPEGEQEGELPF